LHGRAEQKLRSQEHCRTELERCRELDLELSSEDEAVAGPSAWMGVGLLLLLLLAAHSMTGVNE
jgi:hypothetical protein